jgi:flavin reductase (DIM6/NTAB) family NADH-FMN oxidoreductase RutF
MKNEWLQALGKMTYGIYVLTTFYEKEINGMIASWVSQVSYDPPLVMAAVHPARYTHGLIEKSGCFALHLVARKQSDFLSRFKGPDPRAKFTSIQWKRGATGCPVLGDCVAYLECKVKNKYAPGNHTLFLGEVVAGEVFTEVQSLCSLDYSGIYTGKT